MKYIDIDGYHLIEYSINDIENIIKTCNIYGFIYVTENLINHNLYVGQKGFTKKWEEYLGSGTILKRAIKQYGKHNFRRHIINYACDKNELNEMEYIYSKIFNSVNNINWYNIIYGGGFIGNRGVKFSEEHRYKISQAKLGEKNPNYRKVYTEEEKRIRSERFSGEKNPMYGTKGKLSPNYGKKHSEETKKKMSLAAMGEKNHNYHIPWTEEHRRKYKEHCILYGSSLSKETYCYDLDGNFIKSYRDAMSAARELNLNNSHISQICRQQYGRCGEYQWRYAENVNYSKDNIGKYYKYKKCK